MVKKDLLNSLARVLTCSSRYNAYTHMQKCTNSSTYAHVYMHHASCSDLLCLILTFLKKLSLFEENKDVLRDMNIVGMLGKFIPCSAQQLVTNTLKLLFNLSFDPAVREQMVKSGLVPKLVQLLKTPAFRARTLKLLYHLSVDDRCKSMFTYTEGIPLLMGMIE